MPLAKVVTVSECTQVSVLPVGSIRGASREAQACQDAPGLQRGLASTTQFPSSTIKSCSDSDDGETVQMLLGVGGHGQNPLLFARETSDFSPSSQGLSQGSRVAC